MALTILEGAWKRALDSGDALLRVLMFIPPYLTYDAGTHGVPFLWFGSVKGHTLQEEVEMMLGKGALELFENSGLYFMHIFKCQCHLKKGHVISSAASLFFHGFHSPSSYLLLLVAIISNRQHRYYIILALTFYLEFTKLFSEIFGDDIRNTSSNLNVVFFG